MLLNVHVPDASGGVVQVPEVERAACGREAAGQSTASARSPALASRARARRLRAARAPAEARAFCAQDRCGVAELVEAALQPRVGPPLEATLGGLRLPLPCIRTAAVHLALCGRQEPKPGGGRRIRSRRDADPALEGPDSVLEGPDPVLEWRPAILDLEACLERKNERWKLELLRGSLLAPRQATVAVLKKVATAA